MTKLAKLKMKLISRTNEIFLDMRDNCNLDEAEYRDHFSGMGETIYKIDKYESLSDLLKDLTTDQFGHIGLFDDESVEELLEEVFGR
ncbi:MAG: hypothetical protein EB127_29635 [Alphaproteobacteria bacterium]|nr:hypothetical protein [Alphaproteobacteria bacterium]